MPVRSQRSCPKMCDDSRHPSADMKTTGSRRDAGMRHHAGDKAYTCEFSWAKEILLHLIDRI
jgi:hypothetical protein